MRRRAFVGLAVAGTIGFAGCELPVEEDTPTPSRSAGHLDLSITNDDVRGYAVRFEVRDGSGEVVDERSVADVPRGKTHRFESSDYRDDRYTVEVIAADRRVQYVWEPPDCPELVYDVTITRQGGVEDEATCP